MKLVILGGFVLFSLNVLAPAAKAEPVESSGFYDSPHQTVLAGTVTDGVLLSASRSSAYPAEIRQQLLYTIGLLNGWDSVTQVGDLKIKVKRSEPSAPGSRIKRVLYSAEVPVSWSKRRGIPAGIELILPARADNTGLQAFFNVYSPDCNDRDRFQTRTLRNFFYHYRPFASGCALRQARPEEAGVVARIPMKLSDTGLNSRGKAPEYGEVWKDGKLVVTAIFGKNKAGATDPSDEGIEAYNDFYYKVTRKFGPALSQEPSVTGEPGAGNPEISVSFRTEAGLLEVHMLLVDSLTTVSRDWIARYQERSQVSDLVIYSGHAGLGGNVRALSRMGRYEKGRYQVFLINGCDTFAYADDTLFKRHGAVNPGFAPSKHLDIITNSMPAYFDEMASGALDTIDSFVDREDTYEEILARYDNDQRAIVDGEEDNLWPQPFGP